MERLGHLDHGELAEAGFREVAAQAEPCLQAGSCVLADREISALVQGALLHFEGERYRLSAWCVMPNHVHVVVAPTGGHGLSGVLHSWKSFTANQINRRLGLRGVLWERESLDHLIRSERDLERFVRYVEQNPVEAGFCSSPENWEFSSCGAGFQPARRGFVDPRTTPFVQPRSRGELSHLHKAGGTYFVTWRLLDAVEIGKG